MYNSGNSALDISKLEGVALNTNVENHLGINYSYTCCDLLLGWLIRAEKINDYMYQSCHCAR